jgi:hypothetical protein
MRSDGMGRLVARLYARRREAVDRHVPFWPGQSPGQGPGQGRQAPGQGRQGSGQGGLSSNPLINKPGQDGQGGQGTKIVPGQNVDTHAHASPWARPTQEGVPSHGSQFRPVHPVHPVQASAGAGFLGQGGEGRALTALSARICERCRHFRRDDSWSRSHRCRRGGLCLSQRQSGECGPSGWLWEPRS